MVDTFDISTSFKPGNFNDNEETDLTAKPIR